MQRSLIFFFLLPTYICTHQNLLKADFMLVPWWPKHIYYEQET